MMPSAQECRRFCSVCGRGAPHLAFVLSAFLGCTPGRAPVADIIEADAAATDASSNPPEIRPDYFSAICDDGDPCTQEILDAGTGTCTFTAVAGPCTQKACLGDSDCAPDQLCNLPTRTCGMCNCGITDNACWQDIHASRLFYTGCGVGFGAPVGNGKKHCVNTVCRYPPYLAAACLPPLQVYTSPGWSAICAECTQSAHCPVGAVCEEGLCLPAGSHKCICRSGVDPPGCVAVPCEAGQRCAPMYGGRRWSCMPKRCVAPACVGNKVLPCLADGSGYDGKYTECANGTVCLTGACTPSAP